MKKWIEKKIDGIVKWFRRLDESYDEYPEMPLKPTMCEDYMEYDALVEHYETSFRVGELVKFEAEWALMGLAVEADERFGWIHTFSPLGRKYRYNPLAVDEDVNIPVRGPNPLPFQGLASMEPLWAWRSAWDGVLHKDGYEPLWAMFLGLVEYEVDVHIPISEDDWSRTRIVKKTQVEPRWLVAEKVYRGWVHPKNLAKREEDVSD